MNAGAAPMTFGAHLPLIDFGAHEPWTPQRLIDYARAAERLGYDRLCANDHLVFPRPWLDGFAALALVLPHTERIGLMTSVALPVVRGPLAVAKALATLDLLSGGRVVAGLGPGSSARDYAAVGIDFAERWPRFEEAVRAMRALWRGEPFAGAYYSTEDVRLEPKPARAGGPPVWIGSWGSDAGLRRVARLADGWLASAYNTDPPVFADALASLRAQLQRAGKGGASFPNALATTWTYVTENAAEAELMRAQVLQPMLGRDLEEVRRRALIGPAGSCAERLRAYRDAGAQMVLIWPLADELRQLETFAERVAPAVNGR